MASWQVNEAKARFSEVVDLACNEGPQTITRHGTDRAVILSAADYQALVAGRPDFKAWLFNGPKVDDFPLERSSDTGRDVSL